MKVLEIYKKDIESNIKEIRSILKNNNSKAKIIGVVKANGMGLDLIQYSKELISNGIDTLAVANIEEAIKIREAGVKEEILMLSPVSQKNDLQLLIKNDITIAIGDYNQIEIAEEICEALKKEANAHIKIDTGFGRYGFLSEQKEIILEVFKKCKKVKITGTFSHFSNPIDNKYTLRQVNNFMSVIEFIKENGYNPGLLHICASTAFLKYPNMHLDAVRLGSVIQGRVLVDKDKFKKIGIFKTKIEEIKELLAGYNISYNNTYKTKRKTKIAVIPVGYMDGFNKNKLRDDFSFKNNIISVLMEFRKIFRDNSLKVYIKDKSYNVIGKIGMYHAIIDITDSNNINIGDEVIIDITPLQANDEIRREYI